MKRHHSADRAIEEEFVVALSSRVARGEHPHPTADDDVSIHGNSHD
jgi:hypothetical protein